MYSALARVTAITALVGGALAGGLVGGSPSGGAAGAGGAPATGWSAPATLADEGTPVSASMSSTGDLAVVWRSPDGLRIGLRPAGAGWSEPASVAAHATTALTAYDGAGRLVLAWTDQRPGLAARVRVRVLDHSGVWGAADTLARRRPGNVGLADLAVNSRGTTVVAWQWWAPTGVTGLVTRGRTGVSWTTGLRTRDAVAMDVAIGDGGLAAALVQRAVIGDTSTDLTLGVARQPRSLEWGDVVVLQRLTDLGPPWPGIGGVHVDATGRATVAWDQRAPDGSWRIVASRAVKGEPWQTPRVLAERVGWGEFPVRVTGAQRGDVLVTYVPQPGNRTLWAVRWDRPGWTEPANVSDTGRYINDWDVAMSPIGAAVALWTRSDGPGSAGIGATAAVMATSGSWGSPLWLSRAETPDGHARVVAISEAGAAATWSQLVGDTFAVRVRTHG